MVRKENIVKCEECGSSFNNAYRNSKWSKIGCTKKCYRELRRRAYIKTSTEKRQERRRSNECIVCGDEVKPIITYHQCCDKHHKQNIQTAKKLSQSKPKANNGGKDDR